MVSIVRTISIDLLRRFKQSQVLKSPDTVHPLSTNQQLQRQIKDQLQDQTKRKEEIIMELEQITKQARESYDKYFKDAKEIPSHIGGETVIDKEHLEKRINEMKAEAEKKAAEMAKARTEIEKKAEAAEVKAFKETKEVHAKARKDVDEMYKDLKAEQARLTKLVEDLKNTK